ncbi:MAG TPA: hypothetical protein VIE41_18615 [Methylomirabilota bacterium]
MSDEPTWREVIPEGEAARLDTLASRLLGDGPLDGRPLHRKTLAALHARFNVGEAPRDLRHGLFAEPGSYDAFVRFSSGASQARSDRVPDVRGMAVKVVGVAGPKMIPGLETAITQDFLTILTPTFPFKDPAAFVDVALAARRGQLAVLGAMLKHHGVLGLLGALPRLRRALDSSTKSLAERTYFTAVPLRVGPRAVKLRFRPVDIPLPVPAVGGPDALAVELRARVRASPLSFRLEAQRFVDEARTPIEDPTVEWAESVSPWAALARLTIPAQAAESRAGRALAAYVDRLSFDPWHALVEHRPLGAIMRARAVTYRHAVIGRGAVSELEIEPPAAVMG